MASGGRSDDEVLGKLLGKTTVSDLESKALLIIVLHSLFTTSSLSTLMSVLLLFILKLEPLLFTLMLESLLFTLMFESLLFTLTMSCMLPGSVLFIKHPPTSRPVLAAIVGTNLEMI